MNKYSFLDEIIIAADNALKTLFGKPHTTQRTYPAQEFPENELSAEEKKHAASLMRINHSGEVAAQGLYQGQAITSRSPTVKQQMQQSAIEENDHLVWCKVRLNELGSHTSLLNPLWYGGSFVIGLTAGIFGDHWSLGFVEETENQVMQHLDKHLTLLPKLDVRSKAIVQQLKFDEQHHRDVAINAGSKALPTPIKFAMTLVSKVMTKTAYWV